ncbi:IPT/TIG domain-containing protein [Nocardia vaccinii]|uniref:IPT/TIG domain-containing protein n=1 Tax=Nocardia vaccinii TaxID=1822 RepID=UPI00082C5A24|nr:IPT/TIG domain-containing protein [Nocardia vaccinii]
MPISPNQGSTGGGTTVTITGTNLSGATAVHFGSKLATITANTATSVTVTSPSGAGAVGVTVATPGGTSSPLSFFYVGAPFKATLSPVSGVTAGGNTVTIAGTGLSTATSVSFGANSAAPTVVNDTTLTVVVPAGTAAGSVGVSVITAGGTNNGLSYTYVDAPTVTSVSPTSGPTSGGTAVTITGTNLTTTQSVTVGGATAPFSVISDTEISAVTPAGTAGAADVVVTTSGGSVTDTGAFTYVAAPGI